LQERGTMQYPPTSYFALLRAEANDYAQVQQFLNAAGNLARTLKTEVMIYDTVRPQMERLKGMERAQLLLQANSRAALQRLLKPWMAQIHDLSLAKKVRWSLDIDPLEF
jgi:primosomal protein N' (replication factor Y) (superfamily II helicase)